MKLPKGKKGLHREFQKQKALTSAAIKTAMGEAAKALDQQAQEMIALKRILISERAQVIYYTSKYEAFIDHACFDVRAKGFLELEEAEQEVYIKRSIQELSDAQGIVPHDRDAHETQTQTATIAKKIVLPN